METSNSYTKEENNTIEINKLARRWEHHQAAFQASWERIWHTPFTTLFTALVIAIALTLPATLYLLLSNIKTMSPAWQNSSQIALYLKNNLTENQTQTIISRFKNDADVAGVQYISPQQGLIQLQKQINLPDISSWLKNNPLPGVILIEPNTSLNPDEIKTRFSQWQQLPQVDNAQFDLQWLKRLDAMLDLGKHVIAALGILLGLGVLFIVGNTIHLCLQQYRQEIIVLKLIGATDNYVRRPFLYMGILYGLMGSLFAELIIAGILFWLAGPVHQLVSLYNIPFHLLGINFSFSLKLILIGIILGWLGAILAVSKHLRSV